MDQIIIDEKFNKKIGKYPKGIITTVILGSISLVFSIISIFLILVIINRYNIQDGITMLALLFSVLIFCILGLVCGSIGFLKSRIIQKSGRYSTTGTVLSTFGIILNLVQIVISIVILLSNSI